MLVVCALAYHSAVTGRADAAVVVPREPSMASRLLEALNLKEKSKLLAFVEANFDSRLTPSERTERIWAIVERGAPFKLVKLVDETESLERALVEDKEGLPFALSLEIVGSPRRIRRMYLIDPASLEEPPPKDYSGWTSLQALVDAVRRDTQVPAIGLAVWREGAPLEVAVSGVRVVGRPTPVAPGDVWHIGSIGKALTSTLIAKLIEMNWLRWDTTLKEALPNAPMKSGFEGVTLEQLMRHRGGIPQDLTFSGLRVEEICGSETEPDRIRERYAKDTLNRQPLSAPNAAFSYSNAGYALLGHIAERTMAKPFEALMRELVFEPLGMPSARVGETDLPRDRPGGHMRRSGEIVPHNVGGRLGMLIAPSGDMWCTLSDLARFCKAHMDGLRGKDGYLKAETIKRLHTGVEEWPGGPPYAAGWTIQPLEGTALRHGHNGSNGTFKAEMSLFVEQGLIVIAIANRGAEAEPNPAMQAMVAVARRFAPPPAQIARTGR